MTEAYLDRLIWDVDPLPADRLAAAKTRSAGYLAYEAHRGRVRHRIGLGLGAVVLVAVIGGGLVTTFFTGQQAAVAWTSSPTPMTIAPSSSLVTDCLSSLAAGAPPVTLPASMEVLVAERRGESQAALLGSGDRQAICVDSADGRFGGITATTALPPGQNISVVGNGGSLDPGSTGRYVYGWVSARVVSVVVVTAGGTVITASVGHGAYLAWWPTTEKPETISARDGRGDTLVELHP